jgi:hypothetical protein
MRPRLGAVPNFSQCRRRLALGARPSHLGVDRTKFAHKSHTRTVLRVLLVLPVLCGISKLLKTLEPESFNSVPGHHSFQGLSRPQPFSLLWVATHNNHEIVGCASTSCVCSPVLRSRAQLSSFPSAVAASPTLEPRSSPVLSNERKPRG